MAGAVVILGSDTVTVLRGRTRDNWGNLSGADAGTDITGCSVQPLGGVESTDRGEMTVTNLTLYAPAGTNIAATDRVSWLGDVYAVNGPPKSWTVPGMEHLEVELKLVQGQA